MGTFRPLILLLLLSNSPSTSSFERPLFSTDVSSNSKASYVNPEDQTPRAERSTARNTTTPIPILPSELLRRFKREENLKDPYNIRQDLKLKDDASLKEMINAMEERVCGNVCGSDFPTSSARWNQYDDCQACQCDSTCVRYNNCCPDVYLFRNITPSKPVSICDYTVPTHVFVDNKKYPDQFASLINTCYVESLNSSNREDMILQFKCSSSGRKAVPVFDVTTNLSYTNVYCAMCNKVSSININEWDREISCKNSFKFNSSYTKLEILKIITTDAGVQNTQCQITFVSDKQRWCREATVREEEIKTCHANYKSSPQYNSDIERACLMYTSVFQGEYKNVFCFLCHDAFRTVDELVKGLSDSSYPTNVARLNFSAIIGFKDDRSGADVQTFPGALEPVCSRSQFFDNSTCSCQDIHCDQWRTYSPESNQCKGGLGGLGVAYQACLRVNVELETPPSLATMKHFINEMFTSFEPTLRLKVAVSKWCPGDRTLVLHLESSAINEDIQANSYTYESTFHMDGLRSCELLQSSKEFSDFSLKSCVFDIVSGNECSLNITNNGRTMPCHLLNEVQVATPVFWNRTYKDNDYGDIEDRYAFHPYIRTDHCPFVEVSDEEFNETENTLIHFASLNNIDTWKTHITNDISVRMCQQDYLEWSKSEGAKCDRKNGSDDFFDSLSIASLISIASLVSLCLSNF